MNLNNRIKKLEGRAGLTDAESVGIVIIDAVHRGSDGQIRSRPSHAMFVGENIGHLRAHDGETETQFSTRARAYLDHHKATKEAAK